MDLTGGILFTPGTGTIMRMNMDGSNKRTIVSEIVCGPFQITDGRLYYSRLADGKTYSVRMDGKGRQLVESRIAPDYHRIGLEFCGDVIISRYWQHPGYEQGPWPVPNDYATPAIMDANGYNLITFPVELCGANAYEVINWGGSDSSNRYYYHLIIKSNYDGSYWVYSKRGNSSDYAPGQGIYEYAREQYPEWMLSK